MLNYIYATYKNIAKKLEVHNIKTLTDRQNSPIKDHSLESTKCCR